MIPPRWFACKSEGSTGPCLGSCAKPPRSGTQCGQDFLSAKRFKKSERPCQNPLRVRKRRQISGISRRPASASWHPSLGCPPRVRRNADPAFFQPHHPPRQACHLAHLGSSALCVTTIREQPYTCSMSAPPLLPADPFLSIHAVRIYLRNLDRSSNFYLQQLGFRLVIDTRLQSGERWVAVSPPDGTTILALVAPKP